jgi:hypothetical protein
MRAFIQFWWHILRQARAETPALSGHGSLFNIVLGTTVIAATLLLRGVFGGPDGAIQAVEEVKVAITLLAIEAAVVIPVFLWKLLSIPAAALVSE